MQPRKMPEFEFEFVLTIIAFILTFSARKADGQNTSSPLPAQRSTPMQKQWQPQLTTEHLSAAMGLTKTPDIDIILLRYLFNDYAATKPRCKHGTATAHRIFLKLHIFQILEIDVVKQSIILNVDFSMFWRDCRLIWRPENFDNITSIQVVKPFESWIPDITWKEQIDAITDWHDNSIVVAHNSGRSQMSTQFQLKFSCQFNLFWYPFDTHICFVSFNSWQYSVEELNVSFISFKPDSKLYYVENDQWHLTSSNFGWTHHTVDDIDYASAYCKIRIARRPLFHVFNLIIPCTMIMLVCSTVFCIPVDSEEKISLALTIQLTLVVFILMMFEKLPDSADSIPLLSKYFTTCMMIVSVACVCTVGVVNLRWRSECGHHMPIPKKVRYICIDILAKFLLPDRVTNYQAQMTDQHFRTIDGEVLHEHEEVQHMEMHHLKVPHRHSFSRSCSNPAMNELNNMNNSTYNCYFESLNHSRTPPQKISIERSLPSFGRRAARRSSIDLTRQSIEWALIAEVIDRVLLIVYLLTMTVLTVVFLVTGYANIACDEAGTCPEFE